MKYQKPSPAISHTRDMLEKAFLSLDPHKDREAFRNEKAGKQPGRYRYFALSSERAASISAPLPDETFENLDAATTADMITQAVVEIAEKTGRVQAVKQRRIEQQKFSTAHRKPNREKHEERLDKHGDVKRERFVAPMTLPVEISNRITARSAAKELGITPEPPLKPTRLDFVLEEQERYALSIYIKDRSQEMEGHQCSATGGNGGGTPAWNRTPINERKRQSLERLSFVHKNLNFNDRQDLNDFTRMCIPVDDRPIKTPVELGIRIGKYTDKVTAEGCFLGAMRKIAQRIDVLLRLVHVSDEISRCGGMSQLQLKNAA